MSETTAHTFDPSRCEYCGGERWIAFGEPCTACNAGGKLRPWEDWPEPEEVPKEAPPLPDWMLAEHERRKARHERRKASQPRWPAHPEWRVRGLEDRRESPPPPEPDDFPTIGPITMAVWGLDPEAWR